MKYFIDTEFNEDGKTIIPISFGIVADDGREYYAINADFDPNVCNAWVQDNVITQLPPKKYEDVYGQIYLCPEWKPLAKIRQQVRDFIGTYHKKENQPEFWAYYADYDWVVLCQLFGAMVDLPTGWPMYCNDIKQLALSVGDPELPKQKASEHHSLEDARWVKETYWFLMQLER